MARKAKRKRNPDYLLVIIVAALIFIGLAMVLSASFDLGYKAYNQSSYFFIRQLIWTTLGTGLLVAMASIEYHSWQRVSKYMMGGVLFSLILVLLVGSEILGAKRTLLRGSIQPSEFSKLAVIIYIANWLSSKGKMIRKFTYGLIPFAIIIGSVACLISLQPDFSTAIIIVATAFTMFFFAGADFLQLLIGLIFGGAAFAFLITHSSHALGRLTSYLEFLNNPEGGSYHVKQALKAFEIGGPFGVGLGNSTQKLGFLPLAHTDSIFAVLGEELGLMGCLLVIGLFASLAYRGFKIAYDAPDAFGMILATGITFLLIFQALMNVAAVTGTFPFAGIPLPFISYGGSSLLVSMSSVGLLLSISRGTLKKGGRSARYSLRRRDGRARLPRSRRR
jgi:cell division protein FtsW